MSPTIRRLLPLSATLKRGEARALAAALGTLTAILLVVAAHAFTGLGGTGLDQVIRDWLSSSVYVLVAMIVALRAVRKESRRGAWTLLAVGLTLYGAGNLLWAFWLEHVPNPPIPSASDALWLTLYPLSYAGIVALARGDGERRVAAGVWLDGLIAGAGLAAVGAAVVVPPVLQAASGHAVAQITELAYPIGDLLLAALVVGVLALRGWRIDRLWGALAAGFLVLAMADCMYAVQVAGGSSSASSITNLFYMLAVALLGVSAWQQEARPTRQRLDGASLLLVPAGFTLAALGLLVLDHFQRLDPVALALAIATLLGAIVRLAITFRDISALAEARHQASTDDLTALPNRRLLMKRASNALRGAQITGANVSVLIMDLDNFKQLNDTLGHQAGDRLLQLIGPRVERVLRSSDTVARLGGDEFAILLDPQTDTDGAVRVAEKLLAVLRQPFQVRGLALRITASIGIASFPSHAQDLDELMKRADVALYQAKSSRSGYALYARERDGNSRARLMLASEFVSALERDELEIHFQPIAEAASRRIVGAEALSRWRRSDGTLLMPAQFIDAVEQAGLSRALTRRVLDISLRQLASWRASGHQLWLAVNTTVSDLLDASFPAEVADALGAAGLPSDALVLEVTESSVMSDPVQIGNVLSQLRELGIQISLDDFGTGYSSLVHLRKLPIGEVKIDRSFVARVCSDPTDAAMVSAIIQLGHTVGARIVAEGVEDEPTWERARAMGCELIQGYALGRPVPATDFERALATPALLEVRFNRAPAPSAV